MERVVAPTFDTLAVFERLKSADLSETAAKEIAEVLKDVTETNLVTKLDLDLALERTKSGMIRWVAGLMVAQAGVIVALIKLL
jgi:hypothetical protein